MRQYCEDRQKVLRDLDTNRERGLSQLEAETRLAENGKNRLKATEKVPLIRRFFEQLADPMIIILIVAAVISGVLAVVEGEGYVDVVIIISVVLIALWLLATNRLSKNWNTIPVPHTKSSTS